MVGLFIRLRWGLLAVFAVMLFGTYSLWERLPSTFLPVEDQGYFFVVIQGPDGASLERTDAVAAQVRDVLRNEPGVEIVGSISGLNFLTNAAQSNSAVEFAILKPWGRTAGGAAGLEYRGGRPPETDGLDGRFRPVVRSAVDPRSRHDRRL